MKKLILTVILVWCVTVTFSQYDKWIVRFTDKHNSSFDVSSPSAYLSEKAIARRGKHNIPIDSSDLPVNTAYVTGLAAIANVKVLSTSRWLNQALIECSDEASLQQIKQLPFVQSAQDIGNRKAGNKKKPEPTYPLRKTQKQTGANDFYSYSNSYAQVHIHEGEFLHNKGFRGQDVTIAMLDAGFNSYKSIGAFDSMLMKGHMLGEKDFVAFDNSVNEDDFHGMFCLSTIAANWPGQMVGTAPEAFFWLLRSERSGSEYPIEEHNWVVAAEFADSAGADMISSSLGYYTFDDSRFDHSYADIYKNSTMVSQGAAWACRKGMIVMNSAGNEGNGSWKYIIFPADADSVCAVGAVNSSGQIASFSSYGYPGKVKPNVVSVGAGTVIAGPQGPVTGSGTSFSNPNLAGLVACLWQAFPQYNNMDILDAVYRSADKHNKPDNRFGYGIPNMKTAYRLLKHRQNTEQYGEDWFWVTPAVFSTTIDVRFTGRVDSTATVELLNPQGTVLATLHFATEKEDVYDSSFNSLLNLPGGNYTVRYTDYTGSRSITVKKNGPVLTDWLMAAPNPFNNNLTVYAKAPETGKATFRLVTVSGKIIETVELNTVAGSQYSVSFNRAKSVARGVYFVEYISDNNRKSLRVLK
ncbi:S8 family serine peptidase [Foetidibacter luteolus]|uniref:S8 family serine peptidase n=1 Tax=Foetidibacter luteolus TaxID=2608880 RepID=UPI001A97D547|nr:S8 family serine peptidase [Foetidibacter luteolus]